MPTLDTQNICDIKPASPVLVESRSGGLRALVTGVALCVVVFLAWRSGNYKSGNGVYYDSGCYASAAMHMVKGRVLYRDILVARQPVILFVNMAAFSLGDMSISAVRVMEGFFAVITAAAFFFVVLMALQSVSVAFCTTILFLVHFFNQSVLEGGNLSEQYGAAFSLIGALCILTANRKGKVRLFFVLASGFFFSLAVFCKEPFLLSSVPWLAFLLVSGWNGRWPAIRRVLVFGAGALIVPALILVYFLAHHALDEWVDIIVYGTRYVRMYKRTGWFPWRVVQNIGFAQERLFHISAAGRVLFWVGVGSCAFPGFLKSTRHFPLLVAAWFCADFLGTMTSGKGYGHYYLELAPSYAAMAGCGVCFLLHSAPRLNASTIGVFVVGMAAVCVADALPLADYAASITRSFVRPNPTPISVYISQHSTPNDMVWCGPGETSRFYLETQRLSPTKYLGMEPENLIDTWKTTRQQKLESFRSEMAKGRPKFIIMDSRQPLERFTAVLGISEWFSANYRLVERMEEGYDLYVRDDVSTNSIHSR